MNEKILKIAIAEPSVLIRAGLSAVLKRLPGLHIHSFEVSGMELLINSLRLQKPDVLIVNPSYWGTVDLNRLKTETHLPDLKCIALLNGRVDDSLLQAYDNHIGIYDSTEELKRTLEGLFLLQEEALEDETDTLSPREKEIITFVVKGFTNKEIAEALFLSSHTVITHRRNIARKLEIHSAAGLTIYAIVNKLVELDDIKKNQ